MLFQYVISDYLLYIMLHIVTLLTRKALNRWRIPNKGFLTQTHIWRLYFYQFLHGNDICFKNLGFGVLPWWSPPWVGTGLTHTILRLVVVGHHAKFGSSSYSCWSVESVAYFVSHICYL